MKVLQRAGGALKRGGLRVAARPVSVGKLQRVSAGFNGAGEVVFEHGDAVGEARFSFFSARLVGLVGHADVARDQDAF